MYARDAEQRRRPLFVDLQFRRHGVEGDPMTATAEKGALYAEEEVSNLIEFCQDFKEMPLLPRLNFTGRGTDPNPYATTD